MGLIMNELKELQKWLKSLGQEYTISALKNLEKLYLDNNNLTTIPDSIGNLKNLKGLYLHNNNLTTIPDSIGNLKNLEVLDLDNNGVIMCNADLQHIKNLYVANTTIIPHTELTNILYGIDTESQT